MNMYKHFLRPVIYLAICAGAIFIVFITIHINSGSASSESDEISAQSTQLTLCVQNTSELTALPHPVGSKLSSSTQQDTQVPSDTVPTQPSSPNPTDTTEDTTQPQTKSSLQPDTTYANLVVEIGATAPTVQPTTERRAGILAPKAKDSQNAMPYEMIVNGKVHMPNYIPPDVDIDNLDPSSLYVTDMVRRYIDGTISESEKDALVKISDRNAKDGGLRAYHPTLGNIDIGEQIKADRNPGYTKKEMRDEKQIKFDNYFAKFDKKAMTQQELEEFKAFCDKEGLFVNHLHADFLDDHIRELLESTKGYIDINVYNDHGVEYIALGDYEVLISAYNEMNAKNHAEQEKQCVTSEPIQIKWEWTEEEKVIEDENSPYLQYLIALYYGGALTEEEEKLLNEALELFGWVLVPMTTEG